jgi:hypothetical protein
VRRRSDFEDLVELAVARALEKLSIPSRRDIEALNARVDELERRVDLAPSVGASGNRSGAGSRRRAAAAR